MRGNIGYLNCYGTILALNIIKIFYNSKHKVCFFLKLHGSFTALSFKMSWLDFPKPYFIGESQCKEI